MTTPINTVILRKGRGDRNIIWWLWFQGVDNAPNLCKACLASLRQLFLEKEIITLDNTNLSQYVTLPEHVIRKHDQGKITHAHYSDMLRLQLLVEHGGTWLDSTVFCTGRGSAQVMEQPFFTPRGRPNGIGLCNFFITSDPNNPLLAFTRDLLFDYWREHDYYTHYFIQMIIYDMVSPYFRDYYENMPYMSVQNMFHLMDAVSRGEDYSDEKMKELAGLSDFHKLTYKKVNDDCMKPTRILPSLMRIYV